MRLRFLALLLVPLALGLPSAAPAQTLSPAEAVAELFFARPFTSTGKTVSGGTVTYRGSALVNDPDRAVLSVATSPADPCVFEAFFIEAFGPVRQTPAQMGATYVTTLDLRAPVEVSIRPTAGAAPAAIVLRRPKMFCSRAATFDPALKLTYAESCENDLVEDNAERMPRLRAALEVLRKACRW